jgi:hypothetical protein
MDVASHLHPTGAEASEAMPVLSEEATAAYKVEVSGWDVNQEFFVERADLQWSETSGKHVLLSHPVAEGALVFLRLLQPTSFDRVHPVPYHAESVGPTGSGRYLVGLLSAHPG